MWNQLKEHPNALTANSGQLDVKVRLSHGRCFPHLNPEGPDSSSGTVSSLFQMQERMCNASGSTLQYSVPQETLFLKDDMATP